MIIRSRPRTLPWAPATLVLVSALLLVPAVPASGQYFGRNKVNYENFDFQVLSTEHFDIHFYPAENQAAHDAARMAERWYKRFSPTFGQKFKKKPLILYSDHADFQQTNVISGFLGEGTGGVTEPVKNRVVMPLTGDYAGTDHVLGHEIVHVFQFDIAFADEDSIPFRINLLPLWLVEGMAEYLSVGREDPHTAMWLRDAVLQDDFPTIKQLTTDGRYFPYRYGQALWAYIGGRWGDDKIAEIYRASGRRGFEFALGKVLGLSSDSLSTMWADAVRGAYTPAMKGRTLPEDVGTRVLASDIDAGDLNLAPVLSPDGKRVAFLSERDLFSIDVFIADAETGKVQKKLISSETNAHFDALRFIDSAGSWSPDGRRFALVVFAKGNNDIIVLDTASGKVKSRIRAKGVGAISNPAWSPDGKWMAFSGSAQGRSDMYLVEMATRKIVRLTDDRYADLQPAWSPDGTTLAFVTDRGPETDFDALVYSPMRIGLMNVESRDIRILAPFPESKHINPQFSADGKDIFFISDRQGFSDIYRVELDTEDPFQVTRLATGVSGITALSPAISVSPATGRVLFSVFDSGKYTVYGLSREEAEGTPVDEAADLVTSALDRGETGDDDPGVPPDMNDAPGPPSGTEDAAPAGTKPPGAVGDAEPEGDLAGGGVAEEADAAADGQAGEEAGEHVSGSEPVKMGSLRLRPGLSLAGLLPPAEDQGRVLVSDYLADPEGGLPANDDFPVSKYKPSLQLDYIGGFAGGIAVDRYGTGIGGGATAYFSDMLGNHTVGVGLQANGSFKDVGAQAFYQNRSNRWAWGAVAGHIPYLNFFSTVRRPPGTDSTLVEEFRERVFLDRASLFASYPFSPTKRFEVAAGFTRYSFDEEVVRQVYLDNGIVFEPTTESLDSRPALNLAQASVALVGDNSFFGFTSPIKGQRYRFEVEPTFGSLQFQTLLLDYRRYFLLRPFTIAARGMHLGRYGNDSEDDRLTPFFIGYGTFVRGYSSGSFDPVLECQDRFGIDCVEFDRLLGSRIGVGNLELRFPLIGTSQYGLINFPYLPTELSAFFDAGVAWTGDESPDLKFETRSSGRVPVFSTGVSARINLLGALVLETYYAYPFQRPERGGHFGLQIVPGW